MIRRTGESSADARLDVHPSSAHVDDGEHLMRLPGRGEKVRDPSEVVVLLQRYLVFFRQR